MVISSYQIGTVIFFMALIVYLIYWGTKISNKKDG